MCEATSEVAVELHLDRLLLIVLETLLGLAVETLLAVEQVRSLIPNVAQGIDIEGLLCVTCLHNDAAAVLYRIADLGIADTHILHEVLKVLLVVVAHLNNDTWVLSEESLHDVAISADIVQIDMHAALGIGEAHF